MNDDVPSINARIEVRRPRSIKGWVSTLEVYVDDRSVGRIKSGRSVGCDVAAGMHVVQLFLANAAGDPGVVHSRRSWPLTLELAQGDIALLHAQPGFGTAQIAQPGPPYPVFEGTFGEAEDSLMITLEGYYDAKRPPPDPPTRWTGSFVTQIVAMIALIIGFGLTALSAQITPLRIIAQIIIPVAVCVILFVTVKRARVG